MDHLIIGSESSHSKVALFDLDHTLIEPKSFTKKGTRRVLPKDDDDYQIKNNVVEMLNVLKTNYKVVVVSNQSKCTEGFKKKIYYILSKIPDILFIIAIGHSKFRKPNTESWNILKNKEVQGSFFVGDALGRPNDFSDSDLKYAINIGLTVYEPEVFFKSLTTPSMMPSMIYKRPIHPLDTFKNVKTTNVIEHSQEQEVILLVGAPSSGKSTFAHEFVKRYPNYVIVSNDLKNSKKFDETLAQGLSIIIDNTNPTRLNRSEHKYNRIIFFDFPKEVIFHLNEYRSLTTDKHVPEIAIHKYFKNLENPLNNPEESSKTTVINTMIIKDDPLIWKYLT